MDLIARDPGQGAGRRADLSGEVREGRYVVPEERRGVREPGTCDLHSVAGIARKADGDVVDLFDRLGRRVGRTAFDGSHVCTSSRSGSLQNPRRPAKTTQKRGLYLAGGPAKGFEGPSTGVSTR